jgi:integral membrane sensor domain MASE1
MPPSRGRTLAALIALAGLYFVAGRLGLSLAFVHTSASAVWPPTGLALAALLLGGPRMWPAILAGAFLVNLTTTGAVVASLAIGVGNTLEGVVGARLIERHAGGVNVFARASDIFRFAALAGLATAIAASVGTFTLVSAQLADSSAAAGIWLTWWLGDAVGAILMTPLLVLTAQRRFSARTRRLHAELPLLLAVLLAVSYGVFGDVLGARLYPL